MPLCVYVGGSCSCDDSWGVSWCMQAVRPRFSALLWSLVGNLVLADCSLVGFDLAWLLRRWVLLLTCLLLQVLDAVAAPEAAAVAASEAAVLGLLLGACREVSSVVPSSNKYPCLSMFHMKSLTTFLQSVSLIPCILQEDRLWFLGLVLRMRVVGQSDGFIAVSFVCLAFAHARGGPWAFFIDRPRRHFVSILI